MRFVSVYIIPVPPKLTGSYTMVNDLWIPQPNGLPHCCVLGSHVIHIYNPPLWKIIQATLNHAVSTIPGTRMLGSIGCEIHFSPFIILLCKKHTHILQQLHIWFCSRAFELCSEGACSFRLLILPFVLLYARWFWLKVRVQIFSTFFPISVSRIQPFRPLLLVSIFWNLRGLRFLRLGRYYFLGAFHLVPSLLSLLFLTLCSHFLPFTSGFWTLSFSLSKLKRYSLPSDQRYDVSTTPFLTFRYEVQASRLIFQKGTYLWWAESRGPISLRVIVQIVHELRVQESMGITASVIRLHH